MLEPPRTPVPEPPITSAPPGDGEEGQSAPRSCELWDVEGWELSLFPFSAVKDLGSRKRGQQRGSSSPVPAWRESLGWAARRGVCRADPFLATPSCSLFFQPSKRC